MGEDFLQVDYTISIPSTSTYATRGLFGQNTEEFHHLMECSDLNKSKEKRVSPFSVLQLPNHCGGVHVSEIGTT